MKPTASEGWQAFTAAIAERLAHIDTAQRTRTLALSPFLFDSPYVDGKIDLTHNDYLGLRSDAKFQARARHASEGLPVGAGASRLLGGEHPIFQMVEKDFATFKQAEAALYFVSGFAANEAVAVAIGQLGGSIFSDALNHASIIDGVKLSRLPSERRVVYPHNDLAALETMLKDSKAPINFIYTESVFSMDGDLADLRTLHHFAEAYRGILVIDEAHAVGCFGPQGSGLIAASGLDHHTNILSINTCGKALGVQGAFVCGPESWRKYLINTARPFIYSTAPSPWLVAALKESIAYVSTLNQARENLAAMGDELRFFLKQQGFETGPSESQIVPLILGDEARALKAAALLSECDVLVKAVRPPTVPRGTSRLRLSLHTGITAADAKILINALEKLRVYL
jgi:8-amino-7-oxononanoate synthase